ncbi:MAG: type II toxin-antitoxin system RelE/ParE family toxin [Methylobacter sp.]|uniref:type II toxin-antitoxin system RelE/ParE family toxin n=1 Tax=Methylovulum miyakonense TaxID=645578 RepID=UPI00037F4546|nr:type II toxin-antitoxin system RelE/ParE family toxin [Methylovulum miyakonense]PPD38306.1 MAG: type II toxin-antitoxin system RelE/ParE family toxin [Methylobacter sp.]
MQAYEVKIMPQADEELEDIAYFIALDSPQTSQRFVNELITAFTKILGYFPESGSVYKADIRKFSYKGYTAFYRINVLKKQVEILHIINLTKPLSARNIDF